MKKLTLFALIITFLLPCSNNAMDFGYDLINACKSGSIELINQLIENGADVNTKDDNGWTPLHWAAFRGHEGVVKLLINNKASVDIKNNHAETPLHYAAYNGHEGVAELLLKHNSIDVNATNGYNETPLHFAAENGHEGVSFGSGFGRIFWRYSKCAVTLGIF